WWSVCSGQAHPAQRHAHHREGLAGGRLIQSIGSKKGGPPRVRWPPRRAKRGREESLPDRESFSPHTESMCSNCSLHRATSAPRRLKTGVDSLGIIEGAKRRLRLY